MAEISVRELNKYYGENHVLKGLAFEVFRGERVGLLGKNGSGKTTLFKVLSGIEPYEAGFADICSGRKTGILDQIPEYPDGYTVLEVLKTSFSELAELQGQMLELEAIMMTDSSPAILNRYGSIQVKFDALGGYSIDSRITRICTGLQIDNMMQSQDFNSLSGGEKTRVNLARIMLLDADILLLDEPTNHLDIASVEWLEEYLKQYNGTVIVISHDRFFLDNVVTRIIELEAGKAAFYEGNYSYYAREKEERMLQQTEAYNAQQKEIKRLQEAADRMHEWAKQADNKAMHVRAFAMEKRIEHMDKLDKPLKEKKLNSTFQENSFSGKDVLTFKDTTKAYGSNCILNGITLSARKGDRIVLIGANGCGKTTLIKLLTGEEPPDAGTAAIGQSISYCYLPQLVTFERPDATVLETVRYALETNEEKARQRLAAFHFSGKDSIKKVESLSGGEKSRLRLCISMQDSINLLILDEPTNHLDIASREWIEEAVEDFNGTLLFVSHDRYFINRFATRIWELASGSITDYAGTYEEYRAWKQKQAQTAMQKPVTGAEMPDVNTATNKPARIQDIKQEKNTARKCTPPTRRTTTELEQEINRLEERLIEIDKQMQESSSDYVQLNQLIEEKKQLEGNLDLLYDEWAVQAAE